MNVRLPNLIVTVFLLLVLYSSSIYASEHQPNDVDINQTHPTQQEETSKMTLGFQVGGSYLTGGQSQLIGFEFGIRFRREIVQKWMILGSLFQSRSIHLLNTHYTAFEVGVSYFISGNTRHTTKKNSIQSFSVATVSPYQTSSLSLALYARLYLYAGSSNVIPLTGGGLEVTYAFPTQTSVQFYLASAIDIAGNQNTIIFNLRTLLGIQFWL